MWTSQNFSCGTIWALNLKKKVGQSGISPTDLSNSKINTVDVSLLNFLLKSVLHLRMHYIVSVSKILNAFISW